MQENMVITVIALIMRLNKTLKERREKPPEHVAQELLISHRRVNT